MSSESQHAYRAGEVRPHQRAVLSALLWFTVFSGSVFMLLHLSIGATWLAVSEIGLVAYALILLHSFRNAGSISRTGLLLLAPFFGVMMYVMWSPISPPAVFVWILLVPILAHLLLGRWRGMLVGAVFTIAASGLYLYKYGMSADVAGILTVANVGLCALAIFVFSFVYESSRARTEDELRRMALADALTGLANRARFRDVFAAERQRYMRHKTPLSMLVVDVDHFKEVNDRHGHDAGDMALCFVADVLTSRIRQTDLAGRLGGEEFGILLSGADLEYARTVATALRDLIQARPYRYRTEVIPITVSIGIAELGRDGMDFRTLFAMADKRLYQAKADGRNRVVG